jgi:hypothetical protein
MPPPSQHPQFKDEGATIVGASDIPFPAILRAVSAHVIPGRDRGRPPRCSSVRSTPTATSRGHPSARRRGPSRDLHGLELPSPDVGGSKDLRRWPAPRCRSLDQGKTDGVGRSATIGRRALRVERRLPAPGARGMTAGGSAYSSPTTSTRSSRAAKCGTL